MDKPILGQEAVCPDGLGRVIDFDAKSIRVSTYVNDRQCVWDKKNVQLVPIHGQKNSEKHPTTSEKNSEVDYELPNSDQ